MVFFQRGAAAWFDSTWIMFYPMHCDVDVFHCIQRVLQSASDSGDVGICPTSRVAVGSTCLAIVLPCYYCGACLGALLCFLCDPDVTSCMHRMLFHYPIFFSSDDVAQQINCYHQTSENNSVEQRSCITHHLYTVDPKVHMTSLDHCIMSLP